MKKSVSLRFLCAAVFAAAVSFSTFADNVFVWTNDTESTATWEVNGNWLGGQYPTNNYTSSDWSWSMTNSVVYLTNEVPFVQCVKYSGDAEFWAGWKYGALYSDRYHRIKGSRRHLINDARGFEGFLEYGIAKVGPMLMVHDDYTNTLPQWCVQGYPFVGAFGNTFGTGVVSVAKAFGDGTFTVGDDSGNGWVSSTVTGNGSLRSANVIFDFGQLQTGPNGHMYLLPYANIVLHGRTNDTPSLVSGAALHLDASDSTTYDVSDGRVTTWRDVDGGSIYATAIGTPTIGTSTNGLAVVKCASGSAFSLSSAIDAREIFLVFRDLVAFNVKPPAFVGNTSGNTEFLRSTKGLWVRYFGLFAGGTGAKHLEAGEVWYDGTRVMPEGLFDDCSRALHVVSGSLYDSTAPVEFIGAETASSNVGGIELAEVLVYTKELTSAERKDVNSYLRAKWQAPDMAADWDLGTLSIPRPADNHGNISIDEGRIAVRNLCLKSSATTFAKNGSGNLEVGRLTPAGISVEVNGGSIAFRNLESEVKKEMAADASVWLDASQASTFVYDPTNSELVCKWNDPRGTNNRGYEVYATNTVHMPGYYGRSPKIVYDTPTGLAALDFGTATNGYGIKEGNIGDAGAMLINTAKFREGFMVVKATGTSRFITFSTGGYEFFASKYLSEGCLLATSYCSPGACGGYWTVNGAPFDASYHKYSPLSTGTYYVIGLRLAGSTFLDANRLATERYNTSSDYMGGVSIAEVVYYDRILTPDERRNTEAYLMDKWLGEEHPTAQSGITIPSMTFADGVSPVIDTDIAMTIGSLDAAGSIEKKGSGDVSVTETLGVDVTSIDVEEGGLSVSMKPNLIWSAAVHFDASDTNCFEFAEGGESNEIAAWHDSEGRAIYAQSQYSVGSYTLTNGVLLQASDDSAGLVSGRNYVCFGDGIRTTADSGVAPGSGGMRFVDSTGSTTNITDVREIHYVFRLSTLGNHIAVGSGVNDATTLVPSGYSDTMFWGDSKIAINSPKKVDEDEWHSNNRWFTSGSIDTNLFYVGVIAFTNSVKMNSLALDRNGTCGYGGIDICEILLFTGETNTLADTETIHSWLLNKWKGVGDVSTLPVTIDALSVSSGASLSLDVDSGELSPETMSLDVVFDADGGWTQSTVDGAVALPSTGTVRVTKESGASIVPGDYPILTANSITGSTAGWTLDTSEFSSGYTVYLIKTGNSVSLRVGTHGTLILLK